METRVLEPTAPRGKHGAAVQSQARGSAWRLVTVANLLALLVAALVLRGWQLGNIPGLNGDEAWLGVQANHLAAGEAIAWRTPTGNPVNPFLLLPVAALQWVFGSSVVALRATAVASGIAALVANFWLCRRVFDRRSAVMSTALLAVLPITIAYSRFAWDASQTPLATILVLYFGLATIERALVRPAAAGKYCSSLPAVQTQADWLPALVAFGIAIWIHPTNVFAGWLLIVPAIFRYGEDWRGAIRAAWRPVDEAGGWQRWMAVRVGAAVIGVALLAGAWLCRGLIGTAIWRLLDPAQAGLFLRRLVQLFSGTTIFEFIPGPPRTSTALDALDIGFVSLATVSVLGLSQRLRKNDSARERCLTVAMTLMVGTFYLVAGPEALAPHFERYGMCLVAPGAVLLAIGWSYWLVPRGNGQGRAIRARAVGVVMAVVAWASLANFVCDYFEVFHASGGTSHMAFRTAAVEPKLAALEAIVAAKEETGRSAATGAAQGEIWIVADSWWSYWPLAYFAGGRHDVHVVPRDTWPQERGRIAADDELWQVGFVTAGGTYLPKETGLANAPAGSQISPQEIVVRDYGGEPLLRIERLVTPSDRRPHDAEVPAEATQPARFDIGRK
ncbi:MAG TPA: hypothetical protein VMF30_11390 [Pirellulales bacterium]|nr:hypothetical protein [Pirellulales bacterium]